MGSTENAQRLQEALQLLENGQKASAEARLRSLVAEGARLPMACMALGVICGELGDLAQRRLWLQQARLLEEAAGELPSLRLLLNLLVDALEQGDPQQALAYGQEALAHAPEDGETHLQLARACFALGQREQAMDHLERACASLRARIAEHPEQGKAWRLLAIAEQNAERFDAAIDAHLGALALDPNHLPTLLAISRLLVARGRSDEAMPWLMNALAIAPADPDVLSLNGIALKALGDLFQASDLFRQALELEAGHEEACLSLGACLNLLGLFDQAAGTYRAGLEASPGHPEFRSGLAAALRNMGDAEGAVAIYKELLEETPDAQGTFYNLMFTYSISQQVSPEDVLATARRFWEQQGVAGKAPQPLTLEVVGRPLRVGLLSADIGSHVVGLFLDPLLRHHEPRHLHLELISMQRRYEARSEALMGLAEGFHSLEGLPVSQARELLRQQEYDLIVDTSGYTAGTGIHLLAERCAPVQAHYIGYHATTGLATIDWFIGDEETAPPEFQDQFSERLHRLPRPWLAFPNDSPFPEAKALMQTDQPVLGCFCQVAKISEATLECWGEALRQVPEALLVLKDRGLQDPEVRERLEQQLAAQGVAPGRIYFLAPLANWDDHVDHYNILDLALDTTPWSSATTGFEALGMGVPLVALRGNRMSSRMSSSLLRGLNRMEWAGTTSQEVGEIAKRLCSDLPKLREGKRQRQQEFEASKLYDGKDLAMAISAAFFSMSQSNEKE